MDNDLITVEEMIRKRMQGMAGDIGKQILNGGGRCDNCKCKHGWSGCSHLSMHDENYQRVRYRENQT